MSSHFDSNTYVFDFIHTLIHINHLSVKPVKPLPRVNLLEHPSRSNKVGADERRVHFVGSLHLQLKSERLVEAAGSSLGGAVVD